MFTSSSPSLLRFLLQLETEVPNKESTTTCRLFRKKTHCHGRLSLEASTKKERAPCRECLLRSPQFTMPTMLKFTEMEAPNESEQLMQESAPWVGKLPLFFLKQFRKSWNSLLIPWSSSWWCHVGRWTGLISWTISMKDGFFTLFFWVG